MTPSPSDSGPAPNDIIAKYWQMTWDLSGKNGLVSLRAITTAHPQLINSTDNDGWTMLHHCARFEANDCANYLIENGADINKKATNGDTALLIAIREKNTPLAIQLITIGADITCVNDQGKTFLHTTESREIAALLLKKGLHINALDKEDSTPISTAVEAGNRELVRLFLVHGADINIADRAGETPLHIAAENSDPEIIRLLLTRNPDLEIKGGLSTQTALHKLINANLDDSVTAECCRLLLKKGADVNAVCDDNVTPMHYAAREGNTNIGRLLIAAGADINAAMESSGTTPLHIASCNRDVLHMLRLLVAKGADVNAQENDGCTALHHAAQLGNTEMTRFLLNHGADPALKNNQDMTAQEYALINDKTDTAEIIGRFIRNRAAKTEKDKIIQKQAAETQHKNNLQKLDAIIGTPKRRLNQR